MNNGGFWRAPKAWASIEVQGHAPLQKTSRYVSLRCLFLDFETTNERKPCTSLRQSSALLLQNYGRLMLGCPKRVNMAQNQKMAKNRAEKTS